jgi:hypothetical protein
MVKIHNIGKRPWIFNFNLYKRIRLGYFPLDHKPMGCKWIFKIKYNVIGSMVRHKVHLVASGFTQVEGIDFNETLSFIIQMKSIQFVLIVVTIEDLDVHQMNVKIAFLNGNLL